MKVDFTLINPVNHYRKTLVDNLAILNLRAVSEAAGFSTHVIDFQRKFLEEEKTFSKEIYRWFSDEIKAIDSHVFGVSIMNASYIWGVDFQSQRNSLNGPRISAASATRK